MKDLSKKRLIVVGLGFSVFLVFFFAIRAISASAFSYRWFYGDDGLNYISFSNSTFYEYVFGNGRPVSYFFIWLAFRFFGNDINALLWVYAFFFALPMTVFFFLVRAVTKRNYLLTILCSLPAFLSRLNWYYFISILGIMESLALAFLLLSVYCSIRFVDSRSNRYVFFGLLFYLACIFSHERYIAVGLVWVLLILFLSPFKTWKRFFFSLLPIGCFLLFYLFKTVAIQKPFWVVSGDQSLSNNIGILFRHFLKSILNCFTLYEDQAWFSGLSNAMLTPFWATVFYVGGALFASCFLLGLILVLFRPEFNCNNRHTVGVLLLFAGAVLAAASVSTERIEMRWVYPGQCLILLIFAYCWGQSFFVFKSLDRPRKMNTFYSLLASVSLLLMASTYVYSVENRYIFYLVDDNRKADIYYSNLVVPFAESGCSRLSVVCESDKRYLLDSFLFQFHVDYELIDPADIDRINHCFVSGDYVADLSQGGSRIQKASDYWRSDFWIEESWGFLVYADTETIPVSFDAIPSPDGRYNSYQIYVNDHEAVAGDIQNNPSIMIPLDVGSINRIRIESGFTWNPHDLGLSEDVRNLGLHVSEIGAEKAASCVMTDFWIGESFSRWLFFSGETLKIVFQNIDWPFEDNTFAVVVQGSLFEGTIGRESPVTLLLGPFGGFLHLEIYSGYTWNPYEMGLSADRRDLGLYINYLGKK